jgi:hypothetical protein
VVADDEELIVRRGNSLSTTSRSSLTRAIQRSVAGASKSLSAFSNNSTKSTPSSYRMSKGKRDKKSRRRKVKVEDNDPEAANDFLLSGQNDYDMDGVVSSPASSPEENVRGRKRPKDSMAEELV